MRKDSQYAVAPLAGEAVERLDGWLRTTFVELNTELEEAYFAAGVDLLDDPRLDALKERLLREGAEHASRVHAIPEDRDARYELLGMVGFVLGACRRHEWEDPVRLAPVWEVAQRLAADLGVAPRYVFPHQAIFNTALGGRFRTFTALEDEARFVELNALSVLAYDRAAAALRQVARVGVSNPIAGALLGEAQRALAEALAANQRVAKEISVQRFFLNLRPYFKPYRVGDRVYRGANAGDFSAINEIDVRLGLVDADDTAYQALVDEKRPFVPPDQRVALERLWDAGSLLDRFEREAPSEPLRVNARLFLGVCRAHAAAYGFHHTALVKPFLVRPAAAAPPTRQASLTASGPPLEEVVEQLERLRALRTSRVPQRRLAALIDDR